MLSNCHIRAWGKLVRHEAQWIALRRTGYARLTRHARQWYWLPLIPFGIAFQWVGQWLTFFGWLLRWGHWYHMVWIDHKGEWWEYMPEEKHRRVSPPIIFKGTERRVQK